ncbi:type II CAAX prenyl endopeptidase Rce1 family protein [Streptococcus dysgalactiae]|uniref:CPBP family glutamic-type intramembrane protease n=1 Tax=Streptococcus dysgalactiae TaxID=1334 RepID=UPI001FAB1583|nr:CPBP family glutamic-type intramembrane protease [Streptococcus dysgalactiae]
MIEPKNRVAYLKWWDVVVLSVILFGKATIDSTLVYLSSGSGEAAPLSEFTSELNWAALAQQLPLLGLAFLYLWWRRFDFSRWSMKVTPKAIGFGILLFIIAALTFDIYFMVIYKIFPPEGLADSSSQVSGNAFIVALANIDLSLFLYSLMNGFYEEIFFLGICLSTEPKYRYYMLGYSLLVRFAFHTYQGMIPALAIGLLLGTLFYICYNSMKKKNLVPFFVAHAIGDMIGVGILSFFN